VRIQTGLRKDYSHSGKKNSSREKCGGKGAISLPLLIKDEIVAKDRFCLSPALLPGRMNPILRPWGHSVFTLS
jgi:hypothetical protein